MDQPYFVKVRIILRDPYLTLYSKSRGYAQHRGRYPYTFRRLFFQLVHRLAFGPRREVSVLLVFIKSLKLGMAVSFDPNIFGKKYFAVLFYEWDTFDILNKYKIFLHG